MTPYPKTFPSDAVSVLASTINKPTPATAEAAWNVAGYALGVTLGDGLLAAPGLMGQPLNDDEVIQALTNVANAEADPRLMMGPIPFNAQQILKWALQVLEKVAISYV